MSTAPETKSPSARGARGFSPKPVNQRLIAGGLKLKLRSLYPAKRFVSLIVLPLTFVLAVPVGCGPSWSGNKQAVPRQEFKSAVKDKTKDEVIAAVGKPDKIVTNAKSIVTHYFYFRRTINPETGKVDSAAKVTVNLRNSQVELVSFVE